MKIKIKIKKTIFEKEFDILRTKDDFIVLRFAMPIRWTKNYNKIEV